MRARPVLLSLACAVAFACGSSPGGAPPVDAGSGDARAHTPHDARPPPPPREAGIPRDAAGSSASVGAAWVHMDHQPIFLADPTLDGDRVVAGIDIDQGGKGTTIPAIEAILCPGTPLGKGPGGTALEAWGASYEVVFDYDPKNDFVLGVALSPGYLGKMTLPTDPAGPDARHTFTVGLGPILRDGQPFLIDWTPVMFTAGNQLYNALQYNSAGYAGYNSTICLSTGACTATMQGGKRQWSIDQVAITLTFSLGSTEAEQSTVVGIDLQP